jgi:N utilization substance protein B
MSRGDATRRAVARASARLGAVQALYQMDIAQRPLHEVLAEYATIRQGDRFEDGDIGEADYPFLQSIVEGVVAHQREIDQAANGCLAEGWKLDRLDATLRAILRAGAFELIHRADVPPKVSISEYVHVASAFFDGPEPKFVNAALDALARKRREAELAGPGRAGAAG